MKKNLLLILAILLTTASFSQAPQAFKFQTVVRDGNGELLPLQDITLKFQIRQDSPEGDVAYAEQHFVTTNAVGLVSLNIGEGEAISGSFGSISWGDGTYFLEELIDIGNTGDFQVFGTVQLLSVPYSLHANTAGNGIQPMSTEERDALENPDVGMQIYNTTTNCLNYWSGSNWFETCGNCTPMPDDAFAGPDQIFTDSTTVVQLEANFPEFGEGVWTKTGVFPGHFEDPTDPNTQFHGEPCRAYYLRWTISTSCGSDYDVVKVTFDNTPSQAQAGEDILINSESTAVNLDAAIPENGEGLWSVISGEGGSFDDATNSTAQFTGLDCEAYQLLWKVSTECHFTTDTLNVEFYAIPTQAIAGNDTTIQNENLTISLNGNTPIIGTGKWSILAGEGGSFEDEYNPKTTFTSQSYESYQLLWQITTPCDTARDEINISFENPLFTNCGDTLIDERDGQKYGTVQIGEQCWMAENLNVGERIDGVVEMTDNGIIEKYCYGNDPANCDTYGGLYQWNEMMNYTTTEGVQGICMEGWHLPTDSEWCILEQEVDPTITCSSTDWRGVDGGGKLKENSTSYWASPNTGATNSSGFTGIPGGGRKSNGGFRSFGTYCDLWTSSKGGSIYAWIRRLSYESATVGRFDHIIDYGFAVRCLRD